MFVATNKPEDVTRRLLDVRGLLPFLAGFACSDSLPGRRLSKAGMLALLMERHGVEPGTAIMVGDSALDMRGGQEAGMATAAALYGYGRRGALLETGPDFVIEDAAWTRVVRLDRPEPPVWHEGRLHEQENRHQAILYAVMRQGYVSIESLAEELGVSSQTIRRDISELDRTGMLERRPGGASCRTTILNSTYDARQVEDFKDKERIARTIAEYIPDNSSIFLTLGTTVEVIAYALLERSGLMVITNNVVAALTLNKKTDFEVVLASGYMRKSSNGLVGESTIEFVNGFQCDYVITSTGGISEADGHLLDYHTADVSVAQCMMRNANKVLLAASRSKIGRQAVVRVAPLKTVDVLFTNSPVPSRLEEVAQAAGVELIAC